MTASHPKTTESEPWTHGEVVANGIRLHYVEAGDPDDPLVLLLHGFPEFWYAWRHQIPALAKAGYRVVAPDLRGYNESEKPIGVGNYRLEYLVNDVVGLIEAFGAGTDEDRAGGNEADGDEGVDADDSDDTDDEHGAYLVGHDWGGVIAWEVAIRRPDVVGKSTVLNVPHPDRFERELRRPSQLRKSWYIGFFQLPWLPERTLRAKDFAFVERVLGEDPVNREAFNAVDVERYKDALAKPGALTAAINYYRALARDAPLGPVRDLVPGRSGRPPSERRVDAPTLVLWGERDRALNASLTEELDPWVADLRVKRFPNASHWLQSDIPERVNESLIEFFDDGRPQDH